MPLATGTRLGPYEILEPLGAGGMGEVYRARDSRLDREIAIKVLPDRVARDPGLVTRFEREARTVASLAHPNIVVLHSIEQHESIRFLTMELVSGTSLDRQVAAGGLPVAQVLDIGLALTDALAAAHGKGVVHRDLKPANVMLTSDGRVKVLDFGLAKPTVVTSDPGATEMATMTTPLTTAGQIMGTVPYMAPEQIRGEPIDARTDLFALGVVLYELATGRRPFTGKTAADVSSAILRDAPPPLTRVRKGLPRDLERIVGRCLEKNPADRFASATEVGDELRRLSRSLDGDAGTRRARLGPVAWVGAVVLLLAVGAAALTAQRGARAQRAREAIPRIIALADSANLEAAWSLAEEVRPVLRDESLLAPVWPRISRFVNVRSVPAGAKVTRRAFAGPDTTWRPLGVTPLDSLRVPLGGWYLRLEKSGYRPLEALVASSFFNDLDYRLDDGQGPTTGMVRVPGGFMSELNLPGLESYGGVTVDTFWIDAHEVTNREFKHFVDAGGYRRREFWNEAFARDGTTPTWETAVTGFTDRTGRPGPSTWEAGDLPAGQANFPVGGVSWYERRRTRSSPASRYPPLPLGPRRAHDRRRIHRPAQQLRRPRAGPGRVVSGSRSLRHLRHGRQRARVVRQHHRRRALHPRRGLERSGLRVRRRLCAAAVRSLVHQRHPSRALPGRGHDAGHTGSGADPRVSRLLPRASGVGRGVRRVPPTLRLRSRPARCHGGVARRGVRRLRRRAGELHRGVRRRAHHRVPVLAAARPAAVPDPGAVSRLGRAQPADVRRTALRPAGGFSAQERARLPVSDLQEHVRARRRLRERRGRPVERVP
jgi:tRNA A-37 threonylcarbamoyl transferase component Bud32